MFALMIKLAYRNLRLYRFKTLVVGSLLFLGTTLGVLGFSLLDDLEASMRESITGSTAGHLLIHSDQANDNLTLFSDGMSGRSDIGELSDLAALREIAMAHPNVESFVPMGLDMSILGRGNEMDESVDNLRAALKSGDATLLSHRLDAVRFQLEQLKGELSEQKKLEAQVENIQKGEIDLAKAMSPGFLDPLTLDEQKLQFLESRVAPLSGEKSPIYLSYLGTDIRAYEKSFSRFRIVSGEKLPEGQRGILLAHRFREKLLKALTARLLDQLNERVTQRGIRIQGDAENERTVKELATQHTAILAGLNRSQAEELSKELRDIGIKAKGQSGLIAELQAQVQQFLAVDDSNFSERYAWFYLHIAPRIRLYEISPGDVITLRTYTRSGYVKSLPLKVYGVYSFDGLESSDLAGQTNIIDLISFRELYGRMSESSRQELAAMRLELGVKDIDAANAEEELFGTERNVESKVEAAPVQPRQQAIKVKPLIADQFNPQELMQGFAPHASLILKKPEDITATRAELGKAFQQKGLAIRVADWQEASGIVGQTVRVMRLVLIAALGIIFFVTLVIINNSVIVGTLHRTREIGTMRAIGAQRRFVLGLFLSEILVTALAATCAGSLVSSLLLWTLSFSGIPATHDILAFLFSGPRLIPKVHGGISFWTPFTITFVATISSVYAARLAARVHPATAMQEKE